MFNIHVLIDDAKCFQTVRDMRWPDGDCCTQCNSKTVICFGKDDTQKERQRYQCHACNKRFDDLTGTVFAGHHQPLRTWGGVDCHLSDARCKFAGWTSNDNDSVDDGFHRFHV